MSLERPALELINEMAVKASAAPKTDFPVCVLPSTMSVNDLEKFQKTRNLYQAKYETQSIDDYAFYVNEYKADSRLFCYVNDSTPRAEVIFDVGTLDAPGHGKHRAILELKKTAMFKDLVIYAGDRHSQQNFAEFIEDYSDVISFYDEEDNAIDYKKAMMAVRTMVIKESSDRTHNTQQFSVSKSTMEKLDAAGPDNGKIPNHIDFKCETYHGLSERTIRCRVSLCITRDKVEFALNIVKREALTEDIINEFKVMIRSALAGTKVLIGSLSV